MLHNIKNTALLLAFVWIPSIQIYLHVKSCMESPLPWRMVDWREVQNREISPLCNNHNCGESLGTKVSFSSLWYFVKRRLHSAHRLLDFIWNLSWPGSNNRFHNIVKSWTEIFNSSIYIQIYIYYWSRAFKGVVP